MTCPADYRIWLGSMYSLFGNQWLNLHCGPMWKVEATEQGEPISVGNSRKIEDVRYAYFNALCTYAQTFTTLHTVNM